VKKPYTTNRSLLLHISRSVGRCVDAVPTTLHVECHERDRMRAQARAVRSQTISLILYRVACVAASSSRPNTTNRVKPGYPCGRRANERARNEKTEERLRRGLTCMNVIWLPRYAGRIATVAGIMTPQRRASLSGGVLPHEDEWKSFAIVLLARRTRTRGRGGGVGLGIIRHEERFY
jgi:hypothetical protein